MSTAVIGALRAVLGMDSAAFNDGVGAAQSPVAGDYVGVSHFGVYSPHFVTAVSGVAVPMDAHTCFAFGHAAVLHENAHIHAGRALKDALELVDDVTSDAHWP